MDITLWPTHPDDLRVPSERAKQGREHWFYGSSCQIAAPVEHHLSLTVPAAGFVGSPERGPLVGHRAPCWGGNPPRVLEPNTFLPL